MEGRLQQGQKLWLGGSGLEGAERGGKNWEAYFGKTDSACVK